MCCSGENLLVGSEAPNEKKEEEENGVENREKEDDEDAEKQESGENDLTEIHHENIGEFSK